MAAADGILLGSPTYVADISVVVVRRAKSPLPDRRDDRCVAAEEGGDQSAVALVRRYLQISVAQALLPNATYCLACQTPTMNCGAGLHPARRFSTGAGRSVYRRFGRATNPPDPEGTPANLPHNSCRIPGSGKSMWHWALLPAVSALVPALFFLFVPFHLGLQFSNHDGILGGRNWLQNDLQSRVVRADLEPAQEFDTQQPVRFRAPAETALQRQLQNRVHNRHWTD